MCIFRRADGAKTKFHAKTLFSFLYRLFVYFSPSQWGKNQVPCKNFVFFFVYRLFVYFLPSRWGENQVPCKLSMSSLEAIHKYLEFSFVMYLMCMFFRVLLLYSFHVFRSHQFLIFFNIDVI